MSHNRFNTANIMTLATLNLAVNPDRADELKKVEEQRKAQEAIIHEQNKRALLKAHAETPKQQARPEARQQKQQNQQINQPRGYRR